MKKTLTEIQTELRELDKQVCAISAALGQLFQDIDAMKEDKSPSDIDFADIERASHKFMFGEHPLHRLQNGYACRRYIETLLSVVYTDRHSEAVTDRLAFIQWIITQADIDMTLADLMRSSLDLSADSFGELPGLLTVQYREGLLVDAMLTAYITGSAAAETMQYIAQLAGVLGMKEKQLQMLVHIAKCILTNTKPDILTGQFRCYYGDSESQTAYGRPIVVEHLPRKSYMPMPPIVQKLVDVLDARLSDKRHLVVASKIQPEWLVKSGTMVDKGQQIAMEYAASDKSWGSAVTAPCYGMLYYFENKKMYYGVISDACDDLDSIKAWVKQERG